MRVADWGVVLSMMLVLSASVGGGEGVADPAAERLGAIEQRIANGEAERLRAFQEMHAWVQQVTAAAEGTPGHEAMNYLRTGEWNQMMNDLKVGKRPSDWHMKVIREQVANGLRGPTWPKPPEVKVPCAATAPVIDGKLDDAAWMNAATFTQVFSFNSTTPTAESPTTWKVLWDDKCLYFAFDCADADLISPSVERDGNVFFDDCVEMFILPDLRYRSYWELVIGPSGSIYDSLQCKAYSEWGCNSNPKENIAGLQVVIGLNGTLNQPGDVDKGYVVEVAVPFDQLPGYSRGAKPQPGQVLNFMLVRLDKTRLAGKDKDGKDTFSHKAYAFIPLMNWGHNVWNHARMVLANE